MSLDRIDDPGAFPYPHLVFHVDSLALRAWRRAGVLLGAYADTDAFLLDLKLDHPALHYRICRGVTALFGTATVLAVFAAAFHGYRRRDVALLAALLVAVNHLHVRDSHYGTVDVPMTFFVTLSLAFALRALGTQARRDVVLSALAAGLATSAKYNAGLVVLAPVTVVALTLWTSRGSPGAGGRWRRALVTLALAAIVMFAAVAATSPHVVLHWRDAVDGLLRERRSLFSGGGPPAWKIHLSTTLPGAFGWPGLVVAALGLARALWKRRPSDLVLLAFMVPAFASIATVKWVVARYALPFVPPLAILGAEVALATLPARGPSLVGALVAVLALPPLATSVAYDRLSARDDTRVQAAKWVTANLPARTHVAICRGYGAPVLNDDHRRPPAFKPMEVECTVPAIRATGAAYVITQLHPTVRYFLPTDAVLRWLEKDARPVAVFSPFASGSGVTPTFFEGDGFYIPYAGLAGVERGGPIVTIWRLNAPPS